MKTTQWERWVDTESGKVFAWHPEDAPPGGPCVRISEANADEIYRRSPAAVCPACGRWWDTTIIPPPRVPLDIRCACCCQ